MAMTTVQADSALTNLKAAYHAAKAEYFRLAYEAETFHREHVRPVTRAEPQDFDATKEVEARFGVLVGDQVAALDDVLLTPAPDFGEVVWKLEAYAEHKADDTDGGPALIAAIAADVRRLSADLSTLAESVGLLAASCPAPAWAGAIGRQAERMEGIAQ